MTDGLASRIVRGAIRRPVVVAVALIADLCLGLASLLTIPRSQLPNIEFPAVVVSAVDPGASAPDIERLIVRPIETQVRALPGIDRVSAESQGGVATITVQFQLGRDVDLAALDVQRAIDAAKPDLPTEIPAPTVQKQGFPDPVLVEAIAARGVDPRELADILQRDVVPTLRALPGVQDVTLGGAPRREIRVLADPTALRGAGLTVVDLATAVGNANALSPGDRFDGGGIERPVTVRGDVRDRADLLATAVTAQNRQQQSPTATSDSRRTVRIGDIARVEDGIAETRAFARYDGEPVVTLNVLKTSAADELKVEQAAHETIAELSARFPRLTFTDIETSVSYTRAGILNVVEDLGAAIVLTALIMLLFLRSWRHAVVVLVAIPVSLAATLALMPTFGVRLDLLSLTALTLTIGILVDDSIVVLENITRLREAGMPAEEAAVRGRAEIASAAVALTLVDVAVFLPLAFVPGIAGRFLREYGIPVAVATLFSLGVSFTVTPTLAARWALRTPLGEPRGFFAWFEQRLDGVREWYAERVLPFAAARPFVVIAGCALALAGGLALVPVAGFDFLPGRHTGQIDISVTYRVGTPIAVTQAGVDRLAARAARIADVAHVFSLVGTQPGTPARIGGNVARLSVFLPDAKRADDDRIAAQIRDLGTLVAGATLRVVRVGNGGTSDTPVNYALAGPRDRTIPAAHALARAVASVPGATDVRTSVDDTTVPGVELAVDRTHAVALDLDPGAVARTARIVTGGELATKERTDAGLVDIRVTTARNFRESESVVNRFDVRAGDGTFVPLARAVRPTTLDQPAVLERIDGSDIVRVLAATTPGTPLGGIDAAVRDAARSLPAGIRLVSDGDARAFSDTLVGMALALASSVVFAYLLMAALYGSFGIPLLVITAIPLTIAGAVAALAVTHQSLNVYSLLGLILAFGLAAKNGILLVDVAEKARLAGVGAAAAMANAARLRFRPILMTTVAIVIGTLPLALGVAEGAEERRSEGLTIIGGLLSSLVLTLVLIPALYALSNRIGRKRRAVPATNAPVVPYGEVPSAKSQSAS